MKTIYCVAFLACFSLAINLCIAETGINGIMSSQSDRKVRAALLPGDLGDPNIQYFGRWNFNDIHQFSSHWGGAYLKVSFTGTKVKAKLGSKTNYYVKIDDGPWVTHEGVDGTVNLTPVALSLGSHTLSIAQGKDYSYVFTFRGLEFDDFAVTSPPKVGKYLIEYIGDSITAGYTDPQANVSAYAWLCAEGLGVEHTQIAYPGITLVDGYGLNANKTGMESQYWKSRSLAHPSSMDWDDEKYLPNLIVINLGQNDHSTQVPDGSFQFTYVKFLERLRHRFPDVQIFVMRVFSGVKAAPTLAAVKSRIADGDAKLHYVDTDGWLTPGGTDYTINDAVHPSTSGQRRAAEKLIPILAPFLE